jgi:transcription-repair coupling factor (superfamily II helicase)
MRFSDLGLVVIDEEQRFGVEHKEQLKKLRTNVDVLAMSATPIPRTLEMAVTGIREMSTLATPPEERHPILTYVGPYDERQVGAAIRRELLREGQVFFVHNRVSDIDRTAAHLQSLVPEARIRVAHGQMNESELEQTVVDFWERRFDVLVCTTIVETGLDIANANTLILDRADTFGSVPAPPAARAVGRGRERAYAYFMWTPGATLTDTAHDRLATIAGQHRARRRHAGRHEGPGDPGAGNLLGGEQSGHIEGVGFDLYLRMVAEAVTDYRRGLDGDAEPDPVDTTLDLPVDAYLPHDYVPAERLRLEAYRRLAAATDDAAVDAVAEDLRDRFGAGPDGQLPPQVESLLGIARLRVFLRGYGLADVSVQGKFLRLAPVDLPESARLRLERLYPKTVVKPSIGTVLVPLPTAPMAGRPIGGPVGDAELVDWVRRLVSTVLPAPSAPVVVAATDPAAPAPDPGSTAAAAAALAGTGGRGGPGGSRGPVPFRTEHQPAPEGMPRR